MRILTLSVGGRQPIIVFGRRLEWSGPVARLAAIFVLFFWKMQLELRRQHAFARCKHATGKSERKPSTAFSQG
jgi:hypothetical protein